MKKIGVLFVIIYVVIACFSLVGCGEKEVLTANKYTVVCEYGKDGGLSLSEKARFIAPCDNFDRAIFNLCAASDGGEINVLSVKADKKSAKYEWEEKTVLAVALGKTFRKGEDVSVEIKANYKLPEKGKNLYQNDNVAALGSFLPLVAEYDGEGFIRCTDVGYGDPLVSATADIEVSLTVPSTYVVAAGASPTALDVGENKTRYDYSFNCVRDVGFILSENYIVKTEKWGDKSINGYFLSEDGADGIMRAAVKSLEYFSSTFGEYPYDVYTVAQTTGQSGGAAYPSVCIFEKGQNQDENVASLVHQTAHQWWYGVVGNDSVNESFLDESLAEYSTYLFFDENEGFGVNADDMMKAAASAANVCENALLKADKKFIPAVGQPLKEFKSQYIYVNMVYNKGLVMFKSAENAVGRKKIKKYLADYYEKNAYKIADCEKFLAAMGDSAPVFRSFIDGKTRVYI